MAISIGSDYGFAEQLKNSAAKNTSADRLTDKIETLGKKQPTDAELMDACKSFEQYLVEQVMKSTKKAMLPDDEMENNKYMQMFGDKIYQEYARLVSENANLGVADMLFRSIKNQQNES